MVHVVCPDVLLSIKTGSSRVGAAPTAATQDSGGTNAITTNKQLYLNDLAANCINIDIDIANDHDHDHCRSA